MRMGREKEIRLKDLLVLGVYLLEHAGQSY